MSATSTLLLPLPSCTGTPTGRRVWIGSGHVRSIDGQAGQTQIRCVSGEVWLTQASDSRDIIMTAGDTFLCSMPGKIVVQGLRDAMLCVTS